MTSVVRNARHFACNDTFIEYEQLNVNMRYIHATSLNAAPR